MSKINSPKIRLQNTRERLIVRDGVIVCFFIRQSHQELNEIIKRILEKYRAFTGQLFPTWFVDDNGYPASLNDSVLEKMFKEMAEFPNYYLHLIDSPDEVNGFQFRYQGRDLEAFSAPGETDITSVLSLWFTTEFLEERGCKEMRDFAAGIFSKFSDGYGYASPAFNYTEGAGQYEAFSGIRDLCFNNPELDVHDVGRQSLYIGDKVRGAYWLNFFDRAILGKLGGITAFQRMAQNYDIDVFPLPDGKAVVALGDCPESENLKENSILLSKYQRLAELLSSSIYQSKKPFPEFTIEETHRWEHRFSKD